MSDTQRDYPDLKRLLNSWKMEHLLQYFLSENIDIEVLQIMKHHHVAQLLRDFTMGDQIRFEYNFEYWRKNIGRPIHACACGTNYQSPIPFSVAAYMKYENDKLKRNIATQTDDDKLQLQTVPAVTDQTTASRYLTTFIITSPPSPTLQRLSAAQAFSSTLTNKINLRQILESCVPCGPQLLYHYAHFPRFHQGQRSELIHVLASYFDDNGIHLSLQMSYELESAILELFPSERLEDYRTEKRGKIYMRVCNMKHHRRKFRSLMGSAVTNKKQQEDTLMLPDAGIEDTFENATVWPFENVDFIHNGEVKCEVVEENICL